LPIVCGLLVHILKGNNHPGAGLNYQTEQDTAREGQKQEEKENPLLYSLGKVLSSRQEFHQEITE